MKKVLDSKRYSILTDDLEHCIICGRPNVNKHEIFFRHSKQAIKQKLWFSYTFV